jgi:hypothetical protein
MGMTQRTRMTLAVIGLLLILLALAALAYALWPIDLTLEQQRLPPTLFAPPQSFNIITVYQQSFANVLH